MLGDFLRSLLLGRSQEEWDLVLPQIMRAYRSTPHSIILETPNFFMLGREMQIPVHLTYHASAPESNVHEYVGELITCMMTAHEVLCEQQWQLRSGDSDDPPLYKMGDWVWMTSHRRRCEQAANLQPKFVSPYCVTEVMPNHMYKMKRSGQVSVQNEARLKSYQSILDAAGQAPPLLEPMRRSIMRVNGESGEVLQNQEEADDASTNQPRLPSLLEQVVDKPEDQPGLVPPPVEPANTPVVPDEMETPQFHEE